MDEDGRLSLVSASSRGSIKNQEHIPSLNGVTAVKDSQAETVKRKPHVKIIFSTEFLDISCLESLGHLDIA